ncbi:YfdY family protein [Escherichia coli]|uniref:YfdY family protein n=1 Tax=Escherichia coli TaxID=562 RepID=UPI000BDF6E03|nr:YfdY family protein [Escherichia coli]
MSSQIKHSPGNPGRFILNVVSAVSSFFGMVILAALIYYFTMWLTGGNELVTGIFMFLAPACGLMIRFMVGYGRR